MTTTTAPTAPTVPAPTFDDVWKGLMKLEQIIERNAEEARIRSERNAEEARLRSERNAEEARKRFEENEREFKQSRMDFDKRMKELTKQLGGHANRLGEFVQEMVKPAAVRLFQERNLPVHYVSPNVVAYDDDGQFVMEIDLLVINSDTLIAIECKSHLTHEAVQEHLERLAVFKQYFRHYVDYTVLGAVAGMVIPAEVSRYAHKKGLYVLAQSGDAVEIRNPSGFHAKEW